MFGVSTGESSSAADEHLPALFGEDDAALIGRLCIVERWTANLNDAMLHLAPWTSAFHGLDPEIGHFGLLEVVRCYVPDAARQVIDLFEQAAASGRSFHYSAEIRNPTRDRRMVYCFAEFEPDGEYGRLRGLFLLPRSSHGQGNKDNLE